ncbi:MAG TPA: DnaJ family domain-containing protein [Arenicellales bacterium]|nr:DnaJ family domain-containing protein [Arenicellales bacterium]
MHLLDRIAERRIEEAIEHGALDHLPGTGRPLDLDDDTMVPEHLRAAYRMLKNAGYLPREVALQSEIRDVESLIGRVQDAGQRTEAVKRLSLLRARLGSERCGNLAVQDEYYHAVAEKLAGG